MSGFISSRANNSNEIKMFLRADSAEELVRLQLKNNLKFQGFFDYMDIAQSPIDKKWYAWFFIDIAKFEELSGTTKEPVRPRSNKV